jgi:hypothetical protein
MNLMLGDIVEYLGNATKVTGIDLTYNNDINVQLYRESPFVHYLVKIDKIIPIKLSYGILKNNLFFEEKEPLQDFNYFYHPVIKDFFVQSAYSVLEDEYVYSIRTNDESFIFVVKYVHELQQFCRIFFNKELEIEF